MLFSRLGLNILWWMCFDGILLVSSVVCCVCMNGSGLQRQKFVFVLWLCMNVLIVMWLGWVGCDVNFVFLLDFRNICVLNVGSVCVVCLRLLVWVICEVVWVVWLNMILCVLFFCVSVLSVEIMGVMLILVDISMIGLLVVSCGIKLLYGWLISKMLFLCVLVCNQFDMVFVGWLVLFVLCLIEMCYVWLFGVFDRLYWCCCSVFGVSFICIEMYCFGRKLVNGVLFMVLSVSEIMFLVC